MRQHADLFKRSLDALTHTCDRPTRVRREKLYGSGYPRGLRESEIDFETRIVTVADVFDALTADRPYRAVMSIERALEIIDEGVAQAFDPDCVEALKRGLVVAAMTVPATIAA